MSTDGAGTAYWPVVLSDWKRAGADVTITLRSGATVGPGKVTDPGSVAMGACVLHDDGYRDRGLGSGWERKPEKKWNVDLAEIAAVEAMNR
ncbi:hypothetical protein [Nocardioides sp. LHG3406-4]|uniref:hypothetical protein n=1 Tax=Nocardioides sp. LHG3406-4 TaxID=2804575 RepID=UPI003CF0D238